MKHVRLLPLLVTFVLTACNSTGTTNGTASSSASSSKTAATGKLMANAVPVSFKLNTTEKTDGTPSTVLSLVLGGNVQQTVVIGTYTGTDGGKPTVQGALLTQTLWFAGGGDQFAIFTTQSGLQIRHRAVDEEQTSDQPWDTVKIVSLPEGSIPHVTVDGRVE